MSTLPEEIYLDILLRVPAVKSLLTCKCVCKSWFSIISNPDFVKSHLNHTTQTKSYSLLLQLNNTYLSYDSFSSDDALIVELDFPYKNWRDEIKLFGSCNGVVYGWNCYLSFFFLWNPATKEYKRLRKSPDRFNFYGKLHGFGYDYKTDDYKFVKFNEYNGRTFVLLYSLQSNLWNSFVSIRYEFPFTKVSGVPFNGSLHWFGCIIGEKPSTVIVSIDFSEDRFDELQLPMTLPTDQHSMNMGVLEECLCLLAKFEETFEVWVMSDYGVLKSWTKLYTITYESIMCCPGCYVELIGSFKNDEILFRDGCDIISYDSKYQTAKRTEIDYVHDVGAVKYYSESLVSLNSITFVGRRKNRETTRILKKRKRNK